MDQIRVKFTKCKNSKYISHLDLMRLFQRAFRRAGLDLAHTNGFNPQPKLSLATALSLGVSSECEYMDVELEEEIAIDKFIKDINEVLPEGIMIVAAEYRTDKESIANLLRWGNYEITVDLEDDIDKEDIEDRIEKFLSMDEIIMTRKRKKKSRKVIVEENIRANIKSLNIVGYENKRLKIKTTLMAGNYGNLKPELLLQAIEKYTNLRIEKDQAKIHRSELFIEKDEAMIAPL